MVAVVDETPVTLEDMAKPKKPTGGKHKTHRINVGIPEDWHAVLRRIAAKRQQPVVYAIIALAQLEAERLEIDTPQTPWEDEAN
jgi:hypothetical protein